MVHQLLKPVHYLYMSFALFLGGLLFYGLYNELIILRLPFKASRQAAEQGQSQRKIMKLTYWNGTSFANEEKEILYSDNSIRTLTDLITSWLSTLEEEHMMPKKVSLQSVMLDASGSEAYISFDRNPLLKEKSTYQKLMWVEGLLKTIKESGLPLKGVRILVYAKPLNDTHLDFNHAWPLSGYSPS